jgi:AhpD family alkylhydroperoxidase
LQGDRGMSPRLNYVHAAPDAVRAMNALDAQAKKTSLERPLLELVRMRVSQINGCAYCLDMHSKDARAGGESEQRLYVLDAWREAPFYSERERAALAWAEALTLIADGHAPDEVYEEARRVFSERELVELTLVTVAINSWNRFSIGFRLVSGSYKPAAAARAGEDQVTGVPAST